MLSSESHVLFINKAKIYHQYHVNSLNPKAGLIFENTKQTKAVFILRSQLAATNNLIQIFCLHKTKHVFWVFGTHTIKTCDKHLPEFAASVMNVHCDNTVVYFPSKLRIIFIVRHATGRAKSRAKSCIRKILALQRDNPNNNTAARDTTKERLRNLIHWNVKSAIL